MMVDHVLSEIVCQVQVAKYFWNTDDSAPDVAHVEHLTLSKDMRHLKDTLKNDF